MTTSANPFPWRSVLEENGPGRPSIPLVACEMVGSTKAHQLEVHALYKFQRPETASATPVDATYTFSCAGGGPNEASVLHKVMVCTDGQRVEGVVKPIAAAEAAFKSARAAGRGSALVRGQGDIYQVAVGKLMPGQIVSVFVSTLTPMRSEGNRLVATLPLVLGERYSPPGAPPAPKPVVLDNAWAEFPAANVAGAGGGAAEPPVLAPIPDVAFRGPAIKATLTIDIGTPLKSVTCPSHESHAALAWLPRTPDQPNKQVVTLGRGLAGVQADKDLVVVIEAVDPTVPLVLVEDFAPNAATPLVDDGGSPEEETAEADTTAVSLSLRLDLTKEGASAPAMRPGGFVFVVDLSGSMSSAIPHLKSALTMLVSGLPANSIFQIIFFGSDTRLLFSAGAVVYSNASKAQALEAISKISANMGGTEMTQALREALGTVVLPGTPLRIILLTDGEVTNEAELVRVVTTEVGDPAKDVRLVTLGVGNTVSTSLVQNLARAGKGRALFTSSGNMEENMQRLLVAAAGGALQNVRVAWSPPELAARMLPDFAPCTRVPPLVFSQERMTVSAVFTGRPLPPDAAVTVTADAPAGFSEALRWHVPLHTVPRGPGTAVHAQAALGAATALHEAGETVRAVDIACKYGVVTKGTARVMVWNRAKDSDTAAAAAAPETHLHVVGHHTMFAGAVGDVDDTMDTLLCARGGGGGGGGMAGAAGSSAYFTSSRGFGSVGSLSAPVAASASCAPISRHALIGAFADEDSEESTEEVCGGLFGGDDDDDGAASASFAGVDGGASSWMFSSYGGSAKPEACTVRCLAASKPVSSKPPPTQEELDNTFLTNLAKVQSVEGCWALDDAGKLLDAFDPTMDMENARCKQGPWAKDDTLWATYFLWWYLRENLARKASKWALIGSKAHEWLVAQCHGVLPVFDPYDLD
jgi:hypothetical protein